MKWVWTICTKSLYHSFHTKRNCCKLDVSDDSRSPCFDSIFFSAFSYAQKLYTTRRHQLRIWVCIYRKFFSSLACSFYDVRSSWKRNGRCVHWLTEVIKWQSEWDYFFSTILVFSSWRKKFFVFVSVHPLKCRLVC